MHRKVLYPAVFEINQGDTGPMKRFNTYRELERFALRADGEFSAFYTEYFFRVRVDRRGWKCYQTHTHIPELDEPNAEWLVAH